MCNVDVQHSIVLRVFHGFIYKGKPKVTYQKVGHIDSRSNSSKCCDECTIGRSCLSPIHLKKRDTTPSTTGEKEEEREGELEGGG